MDQAPAALTLLGDALKEIRQECTELKEKVAALETVNLKNQATIRTLVVAVSRQNGLVYAQNVNLAAAQNETAALRLLLEAQTKTE